MAAEIKHERRQVYLRSIDALEALLRSVSTVGAKHARAEALHEYLSSQGALAGFSDNELGILPMSLNHQKAMAELRLGSYDTLNRLRKSALASIERSNAKTVSSGMETKSALKGLVREIGQDRTALLQDLMILQRAYDLRCVQARSYAQSADLATQERCAREQRELDATFSLRKKSIPTGKVADIKQARNRVRT